MKYISKNVNLRIVLVPGIPGERLTGRIMQPGKYVKFESGVVTIPDNNTEYIEMMRNHPGFGSDFFEVEEGKTDPYASNRKGMEPEHNIVNLEFGHVGKNINPKSRVMLPQEQKDIMKEMAIGMAKDMAKDIIKEFLAEQGKSNKTKKVTEKLPVVSDGTSAAYHCSCGFTARSEFGLSVHQRKCRKAKVNLPEDSNPGTPVVPSLADKVQAEIYDSVQREEIAPIVGEAIPPTVS